jgi:ABC-type amino acid transport substrate-binding protein
MFELILSTRRRAVLAAVTAASILGAWIAPALSKTTETTEAPVAPLRACADPDNLPFSSSAPGPKGLYVELTERIGAGLGRPVEVVWYRTEYAKRALRNTLLAGHCDLFVGLPAKDFMEKRLAMSRPFATLRYALVADARLSANGSADLVGRRVAVQLATPPHFLVAALDGVEPVTVRSAEEGMRALAEGRVDVAYLWGPSAGYLNRTAYRDRFRVQPVDGRDLAWPVAVAFRRDDDALREDVQRELDRLTSWIAAAETRYGFPAPGTDGTAAPAHVSDSAPILLAQAGGGSVSVAADGSSTERGRNLFNTNCSHCHGPDAASADARVDLRRLARRYYEDKDAVFNETVRKGRPEKGMPPWGGVLPEAEIVLIKGYIDSVQVKK